MNDMTYDEHIDCDTQLCEAEDKIIKLKAENERLRDWLIKERLPNFCTGVECGCAERVGEARRKARIKLRQELEQALKGGGQTNENGGSKTTNLD